MSRCFPYPPPEFIERKASDALIDSIKLQKEKKKASKEKRKEKRREKKEKKDNKRENKEKKGTVNPKTTEVGHVSQKDSKELLEFKGGYSLKRKLEDIEQLEGSSVTEEHGQPLNLQNPSYSSDSTQNSNKRRKQVSSDSRGHGNIIRIKLPLQKHKDHESTVSKQLQNREFDVSASKELLCSTAGRTDAQNQQICSISGRSFSSDHSVQDVRTNVKDSLSCGPSGGLGCSASGNVVDVAQDEKQKNPIPVPELCLTSLDKKVMKKDLQYTKLVQNLYQMAMPSQLADNDDEWLFGGKSLDKVLNKSNVQKQFAVSTDVTCSCSSSLYPSAQFLKEAEIYALPYTVPF